MRNVRTSAYSDDDLRHHAQNFKTRKDWEVAGEEEVKNGRPSHHRVAFKRGAEFYKQCCAHMPHGHAGHTHWQKYSDDELLASARNYQTRGEWKTKDHDRCETARRRPIWDECVAHMRPAANPFATDYVVYAYEFSDGCAYVGLTFVEANRKITHLIRGPVFEHSKICPNPVYKVLASGMAYREVGAAEHKWQAEYKAAGWTPLWAAKPGSLGSIHRQWTKEAVLARAKDFQTRKSWYLGDQYTYSLAKRMGWFEDAVAHMPRRVLGVGVGREVSQATRDKQAAAKTGVAQSAAHRANRSAAVKKWWAICRSTPESIVSTFLGT
jgi:hypothetical protein